MLFLLESLKNDLIFLADFYVLTMEEESPSNQALLILGRPFLKTARTKIDVYESKHSMEFGDDMVRFNIFNALKHLEEEHAIFKLKILDILV